MTRLLNFTRIQKRRREGFFFCLGTNKRGVYIVVVEEIEMKEWKSLYSSGGENMNGMPFNEG